MGLSFASETTIVNTMGAKEANYFIIYIEINTHFLYTLLRA